MKKIFIFMSLTLILLLVLGLLNQQGILISPWEDKDKALLKALKKNQLHQFEKLLKNGANPNAIYGINPSEWVMCEANKKDNIDFLKLAIKYGGDINLRNTTPPITKSLDSIWSAPILCAITMHNYRAFEFLLKNNANIDIKVRPDAKKIAEDNKHARPEALGKTMYSSPLIQAIYSNEYKMAYDILQNIEKLSPEEEWKIPISITGGIAPISEANQWRLKVVDLLRKRGYEINLKE